MLDGEVTVWCGDPTRAILRAGPGDSIFLPRQVPHTYRVDSETARLLTVNTPAGHERFYRGAGEPGLARTLPPQGPPNAAAEKYGIEVLGPPPRLGEDRVL